MDNLASTVNGLSFIGNSLGVYLGYKDNDVMTLVITAIIGIVLFVTTDYMAKISASLREQAEEMNRIDADKAHDVRLKKQLDRFAKSFKHSKSKNLQGQPLRFALSLTNI